MSNGCLKISEEEYNALKVILLEGADHEGDIINLIALSHR